MSAVNHSISELLQLELPVLIEMLAAEAGEYSHMRKTDGFASDMAAAKQRIVDLQFAIELKKNDENSASHDADAVAEEHTQNNFIIPEEKALRTPL